MSKITTLQFFANSLIIVGNNISFFCGPCRLSNRCNIIDALFYKMPRTCIDGKMYEIIFYMYKSTKSCISYNLCTTDYFGWENCVRQGEK